MIADHFELATEDVASLEQEFGLPKKKTVGDDVAGANVYGAARKPDVTASEL